MPKKIRKINENILKVKRKTHLGSHIHWQINYGWFCPLWNPSDDNYGEHQAPWEQLPAPRSSSVWALGGPSHSDSRRKVRNFDPKWKQVVSVPKSQTGQVFPEPLPCAQPQSLPESPGSTQVSWAGSLWGPRSWGTGRYAWRGLPEREQLKFTSQRNEAFFNSKLWNVVWLIRAIINGNIIIQASISKRSHLNEYIFCLGAVAAREPLKRKRKETEEVAGAKSWRVGSKELCPKKWSPGRSLRAGPGAHSVPWARPGLPPAHPGE